METLEVAIKGVGITEVAKACGVSERAVYKWLKNGFLPKTEFFGKTSYAERIEKISGGKYNAIELLELSKKNLLAA
ncbi:helix-turn-helix domain-containing protein [Serratia marcescens]|uniref:helix-turn-helix domain-containing protein n=1 Tax=Serratia marcescens TaxID=615 RepID=UPI00275294B0|nr:helix-turn-helix domain-containing protein [Serratia marcescens]MDP8626926.1 helix-turn-helix domain-containing protein [Serratia marcescens]MDP8676360.1 helix-turn-helix domain-containing protein [Serratia marcescens]MDP8691363.1 helix-turn-helix domain-containing protein [Serratia marcescens]MDP8701020.1 helix-turn-helix domain-containing protein [Serratia marcescens]MDP8710786.1 helix-turn-helix domain-containing protein [Serratia marcescens]